MNPKRINALYVLSLILVAVLVTIVIDYLSLPEKPLCLDSKDTDSGMKRYQTYYVDCTKHGGPL